MRIHHIAGYKFTLLSELTALRQRLLDECCALDLKGTILLSLEGININLAGTPDNINTFVNLFCQDNHFADMTFRLTHTEQQPYRRLKIKLKKEIITLRQQSVQPTEKRAPSISPSEFKQWLDENRDVTILDTRNDYEIAMGAFTRAVNLELNDFCQFPSSLAKIARDKPIVMYCTGGIRCEKAALHLMNEGYTNVYQLDGGILNYFEKVGDAHYDGDCYVFDERVAVNAKTMREPS
jgi:UPF0176 protein